jgi:hypothetical protein
VVDEERDEGEGCEQVEDVDADDDGGEDGPARCCGGVEDEEAGGVEGPCGGGGADAEAPAFVVEHDVFDGSLGFASLHGDKPDGAGEEACESEGDHSGDVAFVGEADGDEHGGEGDGVEQDGPGEPAEELNGRIGEVVAFDAGGFDGDVRPALGARGAGGEADEVVAAVVARLVARDDGGLCLDEDGGVNGHGRIVREVSSVVAEVLCWLSRCGGGEASVRGGGDGVLKDAEAGGCGVAGVLRQSGPERVAVPVDVAFWVGHEAEDAAGVIGDTGDAVGGAVNGFGVADGDEVLASRRSSVASSATNRPSPLAMGRMAVSGFASGVWGWWRPWVQTQGEAGLVWTWTHRSMNRFSALLVRAVVRVGCAALASPGRRPAWTRIWKPLQTPMTQAPLWTAAWILAARCCRTRMAKIRPDATSSP